MLIALLCDVADAGCLTWPVVAVDECQTRWVRLRERFGRELRLHKRGVAAASKEWPLFARMRWLERFIQPRK